MNKRDKRVLNDLVRENYNLLFSDNFTTSEMMFKTAKEYGDYIAAKLTFRFVRAIVFMAAIFLIIFIASRCIGPVNTFNKPINRQAQDEISIIIARTYPVLDNFTNGLSPDP